MGKQALYFDEAERLFVHDSYSIPMLVEHFRGRVSERSFHDWKIKGNWEAKRKKAEELKQSIQDMLLKLAKIALKNAIEDPDPQNIYAAMAAVGKMGQKGFMDLIGSVDQEPEQEEEKATLADMMEILQKKLEG